MTEEVKNKIVKYFTCKNCDEILAEGVSPQEYSRTQIGITPYGFQVWCNRCERNVVAWESEDDINVQNVEKRTWEKENAIISYSIPSHGSEYEMYFKMKKKEKKNRNSFYVSFTDELGRGENMWVLLKSGNQKEGFGNLNNTPQLLMDYKLGDIVHYKTDENGITRCQN